ncbi:hypothetical protein NFI96_011427 [Prochilodus magdalenae]|nr:hypothetical protein NFI96_011427 [Prochilodus magdalenae]
MRQKGEEQLKQQARVKDCTKSFLLRQSTYPSRRPQRPKSLSCRPSRVAGCCPQDAARRTLPSGRCPLEAAHWRLPTGGCPLEAALRTLPTGGCLQDAALRTLPTPGCPPEAVAWIVLRRLDTYGHVVHHGELCPLSCFNSWAKVCLCIRMPGRYTELQVEFSAAVRTSAEQKELILKLEHDLSTIQTMSSLSRPDAEGADLSGMDKIPEPIKEATALFSGVGSSSQAELPQGQMDSLLSIISSQRERFRARNQELEAESRSLQQTMQALRSELDSLRADNIKLYEKIKFLQSYPTRSGGTDDTVMRYSSQYEERLDPFASFSKKERQRRYQSLSPWDKATLSLVQV